ncbi:nucleotide exchange factor GrpE [Leptolyngbya sp. AN02str]|uniref:nucleotide exchange factor GrpE n=1 Tax=Leptolyngbya sp. AN02str TaxID=3423363 RepID=UPI003D3174DA
MQDHVSDVSESFASESGGTESVASGESTVVSPEGVEGAAGAAGSDEGQMAIAELKKQLESLQMQLDDRNSQFMRMAADFDNFRKRTQKEKEDLELHVKCATVVELLPVVDNFERARSQLKPQGEEALAMHKSYQGVYKDLVDRLKRIGVAQMRCEGKEFDPNLHEAVMRETTAEHPEGTVIEELVRGYMLGERVLRHAMVKVASAPEESANDLESDSAETSEE